MPLTISVQQEYMMMVQDWYAGGSNKVFHTFYNGLAKYEVYGKNDTTQCYTPSVQADGTEIGPIPFNSALINGRGVLFYDCLLITLNYCPNHWLKYFYQSNLYNIIT